MNIMCNIVETLKETNFSSQITPPKLAQRKKENLDGQ